MDKPANYSSLRRLGDLKHSLRSADHDGWLLADGRVISRTNYPRFFEAIELSGDAYALPVVTDAAIIGAGGRLAAGKVGGANEVTLTVENLPAHDHGYTDATVELAAGKSGLLAGVLPILTGGTPKSEPKTTGKSGGGKAVKIETKALGANVFIYAGRAL